MPIKQAIWKVGGKPIAPRWRSSVEQLKEKVSDACFIEI
jgi:hypothetical protein